MTKLWLMLIFLYGNQITPIAQVAFSTQALCEAARVKVEVVRKYNTPKTVCIQTQ